MSETHDEARPGSGCGFAVICDRVGRIRSIVENRCEGLALSSGASLLELLDAASTEKAEAFLERAYLQGGVFDWELNLLTTRGIGVMTAAAVRQGDSVIVVMAQTKDEATRLFEQFISVNNELTNTVRDLHKRLSAVGTDSAAPSTGFAELMQLNNDLVNLHREMSRKNAELAETRRLVQSILDTTPDAIYIHDLVQGSDTLVNHGFERMLGYSTAEMQKYADRLHELLLHEEDRPARSAHLARIAQSANEDACEWEYRLRAADGEWRWLRSRETVFERDGSGRPARILGSARDITDQRYAEARLPQTTQAGDIGGTDGRGGIEGGQDDD